MAPYLLLATCLIFLSSSEIISNSKYSKFFASTLFIVIVISFIGLRDSIGNDWVNYEKIFNDIQSTGETQEKVEFGFILINKIAANLNFNFNYFILILSIFSISIKVKAFKKLAPHYLIALVVYLAYFMTEYEMSGVRQALAMGFSLMAAIYVLRGNFKIFLFYIFLGSTIHISILFYLPVYFLNKFNLKTSSAIIIMLLSVLFVLLDASSIILKLINLIPFGSLASEKLISYANTSNYVVGFTLGHALYIFLGLIFIYYKNKCSSKDYNFFLNSYLVGLAFSFLFSGSLDVLNRTTYYYLISAGILFSIIIQNVSKGKKIIIFSFVSLLLISKIVESVTSPEASIYYLPYKIFLF